MSALPGETREGLLQRVRAALGRTATPQTPASPPPVDDPTARLVSSSSDLITAFMGNASAVGMHVQQAAESEAMPTAIALLRDAQARRVGVSEAAWVRPLQDAGFDVVAWASQSIDAQFDLDAGVTGVEAAIAETGSLVCISGPGRSRGLSLVPPVHIAVVRATDIIADLLDLWPRLRRDGGTLPSSAAIITGPSKTADIEGILVTGVHGPERVHVIVVR